MNIYIVNEIRKKWWQIVLTGIICAIVIIISRTVISKPVMVHGPINASIIFVLDDKTPNGIIIKPLQLKGLLNSESFITGFLNKSANEIDWSKMDSNFSLMDTTNQFKWHQRHFLIKSEDPRIYELNIMFNPNDVQDTNYVVSHLDVLIDEYINYINIKVQTVNPNYSIRIIDKQIIEEPPQFQQELYLPLKYGFIGFILGGLVMILFISVTSIRKYRYDR